MENNTQRKSYSLEFQINSAKKVARMNPTLSLNKRCVEVSEEVGVNRRSIERWYKKYVRGGYNNLKPTHAKKMRRAEGGGRKVKYPEMEDHLGSFSKTILVDEFPLATTILQDEALEFDPNFLGGVQHPRFEKRWACYVHCFMKRHNIVFRRPTSVGQRTPLDKEAKQYALGKYVFRKTQGVELKYVFHGDETPLAVEDASQKALAFKGADSIQKSPLQGKKKKRLLHF